MGFFYYGALRLQSPFNSPLHKGDKELGRGFSARALPSVVRSVSDGIAIVRHRALSAVSTLCVESSAVSHREPHGRAAATPRAAECRRLCLLASVSDIVSNTTLFIATIDRPYVIVYT